MKIETQALVIGAGPIGLFQAFELGLLGVDCHIVEALGEAGGQCTELYADKPIYDIPGTAFTTAADFIAQLLLQLRPFNTNFHFQQTVETLRTEPDGSHRAVTSTGTVFIAKHVFIATGAGAFTPVKLRVDGLAKHENKQVFYTPMQPKLVENRSVVVTGDGETAVTNAIEASDSASDVLFLHRKRRLDASAEIIAKLEKKTASGKILQIKGKITGFTGDTNELSQIHIQSGDTTTTHDVDLLLVRQGNSPKQSDIESWGIESSARHIPVDTAKFETNLPGVYAVGDINNYPAKRKLILCGFHEATLAAFAAAAELRPDKPIHLQYTTTSTELQKRLGV